MDQSLLRLTEFESISRSIMETIITNIVLIGQTPAPTFHELNRCNVFMERLIEFQVNECSTDGYLNPIGIIRGKSDHALAIFIVAHMDTVFDSGSTDKTCEIAKSYGADVYKADDILPHLPKFKGKGKNLWKFLYITKGDIIIYLDADIKNIHHQFAYGLIGPLLMYEGIKYTKAYCDRPLTIGIDKIRPTGGRRVTELVIRPLSSIFFLI